MKNYVKLLSSLLLFTMVFQLGFPQAVYGNTAQEAKELPIDTYVTGQITPIEPEVYYKFTTGEMGKYTASSTGTTDLSATLYSSKFNIVKESVPNGDGGNFMIESNLVANSTYYLKVEHTHDSIGAFKVRVSMPPKDMPQAVMLFTGYHNSSATYKYPDYTDGDISKMLDSQEGLGTKEFVIATANTEFNTYMDGDTVKEIVSIGDIQNMDSSMVGAKDPSSIKKIKEQYSVILTGNNLSGEPFDPANTALGVDEGDVGPISKELTLDSFAKDSADLAKRLIEEDSNVKIWFSLPVIGFTTFAESYINPYKNNVIEEIKSELTPEQWENNVAGFYFGTEALPSWYTPFDVNSSSCYGNPVVKTMKELSTYVHGYDKEFMWIPYYGPHTESVNSNDDMKIGYIANKTNLFDYVIIQPTYYFDPKQAGNIYDINASVKDNVVKDHDGNIVGNTKTFDTMIGAEMEIDSRFIKDPNYAARYEEYVKTYGVYKDTRPSVYYAGDRNELMRPEVMKEIREFYSY